jgi:hypothetical protein
MASPHVAALVARCYRAGACKAEKYTELNRIMAITTNYNLANPRYGFQGDPKHPEPGKYFGYMVYGNKW